MNSAVLELVNPSETHITSTVSKATCIQGFIKQWAKEFACPYVIKQFFTTLVRPILEHGSIVWDPQ